MSTDIRMIKLCVANLEGSSCPRAEGVPTGIRTVSPLSKFGQGPSCSLHRSDCLSAMLQEKSVKGRRGAKHKRFCPFDDQCVKM